MALKNLTSEAPQSVFIKTGYQDEKVPLEEIFYIEADGNYLTLVLANRKILTRQTMPEMLQLLPAGQFIRVHRSYIVAIHKIERINRQEIGVAGATIPIGVSFEEDVKYIRKKLAGK